jgi:osmotically inducible lipoprotein OsmB
MKDRTAKCRFDLPPSRRNQMKKSQISKLLAVSLLAVTAAGCSTWDGMSSREKSTVGGAAVGAAGGAALGGGVLGTVGGAAVGGVVGNQLGK